MLRPLPFEAVRQEHHEPREPIPLIFGADDELVDDDLRTVDEVAELRLPHDEPVGAVEAVAVLEAEHAGLGQRAVVDLDRRLIGGEVLEGAVSLVGHAVVDHGMAVAEGAPLAILPGETHPHPLGGERCQGQGLGGRPIEDLLPIRHLLPDFKELLDLRVRLETIGQTDQLPEQMGENIRLHPGVDVGRIPLPSTDVGGPDTRQFVGVDVVVALGDGQLCVELCPMFLGDPHRLLAGHFAELEELLEVALVDARPLLDHAVEGRLGERRLVGLVVTAAPEAIHVDDDIPLELAAEVHGQIDHLCDRFGILAVDVEDGDLEHLRHVGGIGAGTGLAGAGGEADLVVDDDMERAADAVGVEFAKVERLLDDALPGKCRVAVDQHHHPRLPGGVADPILTGPHAADGDGIDELQMARIEAEREVDIAAIGGTVIA